MNTIIQCNVSRHRRCSIYHSDALRSPLGFNSHCMGSHPESVYCEGHRRPTPPARMLARRLRAQPEPCSVDLRSRDLPPAGSLPHWHRRDKHKYSLHSNTF